MMATMTPTGRVLLVTLTAEETALWKRGDTQEAAKYRLTIKRPANAALDVHDLAKAVYVDHEGAFLEDSATHVRAVDPRTIETRCRSRDVWPAAIPPTWRYKEMRAAIEGWADEEAEDVKAWLHEASRAVAASPDMEIDLDPTSPVGAAIVAEANRRLLAFAMG